ncbi:MAG: hypothetical protein L0312_06115 [Acidobacteria bacterium]|nr:hypothetical protein [Acidobacteriota bacterium]
MTLKQYAQALAKTFGRPYIYLSVLNRYTRQVNLLMASLLRRMQYAGSRLR